MHTQRLVLLIVALLGALTPALPWRTLGLLSAPLTIDTEATVLVAGGFLISLALTSSGDRTQPLRSSKPRAALLSLFGLLLLGLVGLVGSTIDGNVQPGVGLYAAGGLAAVLTFGAWIDVNKR